MAETLPGVVRMGMIRRLETLSPLQFSEHWKGPHGAIASLIPNLRRYHQNHFTEAFRIGDWPDVWRLDGLSELWFDDIPTMLKSIASPDYTPLARDTPTVMTMPGLIAGTQERELAFDGDVGGLVKAMLVLGRAASTSQADFAAAWRDTAASLRNLIGLGQIVSTFVNHWESEPGRTIGYEHLPVDVVCELWFDSGAALRAAMAGPVAERLASPLAERLGNLSCHAAQTHVIVA
jgi:uncharacterized protein (TIGR02118 family)